MINLIITLASIGIGLFVGLGSFNPLAAVIGIVVSFGLLMFIKALIVGIIDGVKGTAKTAAIAKAAITKKIAERAEMKAAKAVEVDAETKAEESRNGGFIKSDLLNTIKAAQRLASDASKSENQPVVESATTVGGNA